MRPFSLLVKPAGSSCNLSCPYCFYRDHPEGRMTAAVLERLLTGYAALPMAEHAVCFQGGEPTLMGEDFFRRAAALAPDVSFSLQTNATRVTPSMAAFFAERHWLVGVSPHADDCVAGLRVLQQAGVDVNLLQLVTKDNVDAPERLYHYLRDELGEMHHQYIECTAPASHAITGEQWGTFLTRLFDEWRRCEDERRVSVRLFDSLVNEIVYGFPTLCSAADDCRQYLTVDFAGDVYPCDFYVSSEWKLGNVMSDDWATLVASPRYAAFGRRHAGLGDCPRNPSGFAEAMARFRAYALPYLRTLV